MKRLFVILIAFYAFMPSFAQTLTGRSNPVHLEISSKPKSSPPVMVWLSPEQTSSVITGAEVTIKVGVNSTINLKNVTVLINGSTQPSRGFAVTSPDASKFTKFIEQKVTLSPGPNEIKIVAVNENGESTTESRQVNMTPVVAIVNAETRTDYALIIATNEYSDWGDLTNPVNDAKAIATELGENYGFKVETLFNASKSQIVTKIREYAKKNYGTDDQLFIFIAGHGQFDEIGKDGYIVAKDSQLNDDTYDTYVPFSVLRTTIDNNPAKHVFLTMDVCFGGTFDQAIAKRGDDRDQMYTDIPQNEYISKKLKFKTRIYMTSGGKQYVPDGRPGKHSPFASKFLEALRGYGGTYRVLTASKIWLSVETAKPEPRFGAFGDNEPGSEFVFQAR
ncbi:MAG TPA: caspase family protein [Cyclobacteriaceae bacterium]|nr:caspase family protein [Cyclobacteriaceae bacterium]